MIEGAFIDRKSVAAMLGLSADTFTRRRPVLVAGGFPEPDPLVGRYLKSDVETWIKRRARLRDEATMGGSGINLDAL